MVRQIKYKLQSNAGATIIFAIVGLLVAVIAGMTMVTTAMNNLHRIDGQQRNQQEYLAVTSAASLLREQITGQRVLIVEELGEYNDRLAIAYGINDSKTVVGGDGYADIDADHLRCTHIKEEGLGTEFVKSLCSITEAQVGEMTFDAGSKIPGVKAEMRLEPMKLNGSAGKIAAQFGANVDADSNLIMPMMTLTFPNIHCNKIGDAESWNYVSVPGTEGEMEWSFNYHVRVYEVVFGKSRITSGGIGG